MDVAELAEAQAEAHAEFRELAVDYWGINKDNGKRSEIAAIIHRQTVFEDKCREYLYKDRAITCPHSKTIEKLTKEDREVKTEKIKANAQVTATLIGQVFTLIGIVALAMLK
jgi:hypothetical protein